ncbi:MAG TPA: PAS domain S-box protein [Gemmatimonadaceae bacterium]|jgi:PAS domain S-box-containing protein|nr:PAS domain S-box protein [Gemmatimonadaceae bacterium]
MTVRIDKPENSLPANPEAWLAAIVESSDDAIVGKTLDGTIRSWNAGAQRVFGYAPHEIVGQSVRILIPPELQREEDEIVARLKRGERVDHHETTRLRKDGSCVEISLSVSPIRDRSGHIVGAAKIARDITEAKRLQRTEREYAEQMQNLATELEQQVEEGQSLQEELEQTNEQLLQALEEARDARQEAEHANAAKSQFLATMSHELRTPLNAIAGYVDLLDAGVRGDLNPEQRDDLRRIKRSEETLLRLIDNVLSFAKLESGRLEYHFEEVRLNEFVDTLESFIAPRLTQKGLTYSFAPCALDTVVSIDRDKVEQILLNLLSNAVKFTDTGGIDVRCVTDETHVRIRVHDTGRGMHPDLLDSIFEPFVQGDRSLTRTAEGTGLGLSISLQLARAMGCDITVESIPGDGSTFTLVLPRTAWRKHEGAVAD